MKNGYEFVKWIFVDFDINVKDEILTLYFNPKFSLIKYDIEYNLDDGILEGEYPTTFDIFNEVVLPIPQKEGYEFVGWEYKEKL